MEEFLNSEAAPYALAGLAAMAVAAVAYWVTWLSTSLGEEAQRFDSKQLGLLIVMLPLARRLGNYTEAVRFMPLQKYEIWAARNLSLSGLNDLFSPREYVGSHLALFLLGISLPLFLMLYPDSQIGQVLAVSLVLGILLFFMPFFVLNDIINKRRHAIFKSLPYFLDLVTLLVESGLDFSIAMDRAAQQLGEGPLQDEVNRFTRQIQLGQPRRKALTELADRSDLPQMKTLSTALIQQEQLGSKIETVLRRQSEILRFQRMQMAETKANKAPVQILIPMVLFIFPSIFLILIGPMIIKSTVGAP